MLTLDTEVDRKLASCFVIPLFLSALIVVTAAFGAARLEFKYAVWIREAHYLPLVTDLYRDAYQWGWALPVAVAICGAVLVRKPNCKLRDIAILAGTECVLLTLWVTLSVLAFYLGNQAFVGVSR